VSAISIRQLQAFICVARSTTFAEAAEKMFLSQPALSTAIKKMESQLGGPLFSRTTRKVELSPEGQTFLPVAMRLMNDWDSAIMDVHNLFAKGQGKLSLAAMPSFAAGLLPSLLAQFHQSYPNIKISVNDVVMESVLQQIRDGRVELGFSFEHDQLEGLTFYPLFNDEFMVVLNAGHPLAHRSHLRWVDMCDFPFVAMNNDSSIRRWIDSYLQEQKLRLNVVAEAGQLATLGRLVKHGLGISVVPCLCREQMQNEGLVCLPFVNSGLQKRVGMVKSSRGTLSVAAHAFWHWVEKHNQQIDPPLK
jgi:LysR family transcriptional regulator, carnitine catabolism transcriptional activator